MMKSAYNSTFEKNLERPMYFEKKYIRLSHLSQFFNTKTDFYKKHQIS